MREIPNTPIYCTANGEKSIKGQYHENWNFKIVKTGDTLNIGAKCWPKPSLLNKTFSLSIYANIVSGQWSIGASIKVNVFSPIFNVSPVFTILKKDKWNTSNELTIRNDLSKPWYDMERKPYSNSIIISKIPAIENNIPLFTVGDPTNIILDLNTWNDLSKPWYDMERKPYSNSRKIFTVGK